MKIGNRWKLLILLVPVLLVIAVVMLGRWLGSGPRPGTVGDEAKTAHRAPESFVPADEDYFHDMDGGIPLSPDEVRGRNMWVLWTGGNDRLWDRLTASSFGALDLLKTLSSHPSLNYGRESRWDYLGLVNEPCFEKATGPNPDRFGLWLDKRKPDCPADPFENEAKYPGVAAGARGKALPKGNDDQYLPKDGKMPIGSYYGFASGIVGLRLFPNPDFDAKAAAKWDPERYYTDPTYYQNKDLIRPYRVGMSCTFCHVGPNPTNPPSDPENPKWENLSNNVGAQYFWVDRIFDWSADPSSYAFQMFHTARPGTLDTSLVSTDNINNPRTMNAIYQLGPRLEQARRFGKETLAPLGQGSGNNKQLNDFVAPDSPLADLFVAPNTSYSPRILKDGADSVGPLGALNRVYLNIGLFSEEWLLHFRPLVGGKEVTPIQISDARNNSSYWQATELQTKDMALFLLRASAPHKLKDAPGGMKYLGQPGDVSYSQQLERGKVVFAETCARCHSSKLPQPAEGLDPGGCSGKDYLQCWDRYWNWTKTEDFKSKMRSIVQQPDFLENNYLSAEHRVPVTLLETNACSPLASNAIRDNIWDNFSSETYKDLPSVGSITVYQPITGEPRQYQMPAGGRGYTRPASLVSLWSTAPFLLNNTVGKFNPSPTVDARMDSFQDSIEKLLWPEKREKDSVLGAKVPGVIDRTTERSYLRVPAGYVPDALKGWGASLFPYLFEGGGIEIGPIPPKTPVGLLASLDLRPSGMGWWERVNYDRKVIALVLDVNKKLRSLPDDATDEDTQNALSPLADRLMELSKCPDYVVNRGHYFGTGYRTGEPGLSDPQKRDLIEYLKTF